jgi:LysM repeat protein
MRNSSRLIYPVIAALVLAGCTVSYSASPVSTQQHGATSPADATMNAIRSAFFTQTAQAHLQNGETPAPAQATNTPSFATVAPTVEGETPASTSAAASATAHPTQTVAVSVPTSTPGLPATYIVHENETVYCIARRFNVDQAELLEINGMDANSFLAPDDVLKIPTSGDPFIGQRTLVNHSAGMAYTVKTGQDNVFAVACYFGDVDPNRIIAANSLKTPFELTPGQSIVIP